MQNIIAGGLVAALAPGAALASTARAADLSGGPFVAGCAESSGWTVERIFYYNPVGGLGWWVNNRLLRRWTGLDSGHVNLQFALFDRLVLPLSKTLDRITEGFFGQSLLMVAHPREQETDN